MTLIMWFFYWIIRFSQCTLLHMWNGNFPLSVAYLQSQSWFLHECASLLQRYVKSYLKIFFLPLIKCFYQLIFRELNIPNGNISSFLFFMNWCSMSLQAHLLRKTVVANVTFERLLSFMNNSNVCIHVTFLRTAVVTSVTFEWLLSFMNRGHMSLQDTL